MPQLSTYPSRTLARISGVDASGNVGLSTSPAAAGIFYPEITVPNALPTQAQIEAAMLAAYQAGGGEVKLVAGRINTTSSITLLEGVSLVGVPAQIDFRGGRVTARGGTQFVGNGLFTCFRYNDADLTVAPTDYDAFVDDMLVGVHLRNIVCENYSYALKVGGLFNPGWKSCLVERFVAIACTRWGIWIENDIECDYIRPIANNCTRGQIANGASGNAALNCGNGNWIGTYASNAGSILSRGYFTFVRGASNMTQKTSIHECSIGNAPAEVVQAATMANGSKNIGVTDSTQFPFDMAHTFSASVNGVTSGHIYFPVPQATFQGSIAGNTLTVSGVSGTIAIGQRVADFFGYDEGLTPALITAGSGTTWTIDGSAQTVAQMTMTANTPNVIQISESVRGSALTMTGNTAVNAKTMGFQLMEHVSLDASSNFIGVKVFACDIEGRGSAHLLLQDINQNYEVNPSIIGDAVLTYKAIVRRRVTRGTLYSYSATSVDDDSGTSQNWEISYTGSTLQAKLGNNILLDSAGFFDYGRTAASRWAFQNPLLVGTSVGGASSSHDALTVNAPGGVNTYGYSSWVVTTNGNIARTYSQGSGNGGAGNTYWIEGIVGSNSDSLYNMNAPSGTASGDYVWQSYFSGYNLVLRVPAGTKDIEFGGTFASATYTVATLPAAGRAGRRAFVTDANSTTFAATAVGSGSNKVPVYDTGSAWQIG